ncbi:YicC family protein [Nonlabens mediterrranea]|uniref:YicC family protein n=1 Tax=Nonlabens mediterrranea TaxID=1419947 RepID=A0ABS0A9Y9_9FLAO|nr:YicC family protein [Nonlabens mediterrranea]
MILSMTGYGKSVTQLSQKKITVEIRTLNSKNLDLNMRLSNAYKEKELPLRQLAASELSRGKVDFAIHVEKTGVDNTAVLNTQVLESYIQQLKTVQGISLNDSTDDSRLLQIATKFPDVFATQIEEVSQEEFNAIEKTSIEALNAVNQYRKDEGKGLKEEFILRINNISQLLEQIKEVDETRLADIRIRLEKAVSDLKEKVDGNRFEQELIFYLEKYDITEEKVRLKNHLDYFKETLDNEISQGKKLGFISQEIGREINTIGSKANHATMQQLVVQMKDELEKVKEQMLNVL